MSSQLYNSQENGPKYFDSEETEFHPAFRPDDIRSYAEIVSFWDDYSCVNHSVNLPRVYNPSRICREVGYNSYMVAESKNYKPKVYNGGVAVSHLRFKTIPRVSPKPLSSLINWYCNKFGNANEFYNKFRKVISKFNIKKFIKKNKGMPYTRRTLHRMAICKAWERLAPSFVPIEMEVVPQAGGFVYNQLFKNVKKIGFDYKPKIKKNKKKEKISNKRRSPFFRKQIPIMDRDENVLKLYWLLYAEISSPILPIEKTKKDWVKIRHFRYLYAKMLQRKRTPSKIGVSLNNIYKAKALYSKNYLNPKIFATTTNPAWKQWIKENCPNAVCNDKKINFEMDTAHSEGVSAVQCKKSGNVIFMDETAQSVGYSPKRLNSKMSKVSHADSGYSMSHASERELVIDTFEWDDRASQSFLKKYCFPAVILEKLSKSPNSVPFQMSTFYNGDFDINIRVNSNKFQAGMLQCSWLYDPGADKNIKYRENIFTLSQTNHCLINAGGSNVGTLHVPYISTYTALPTVTNVSNNQCLNLGSLYIYVLNKLQCPDSVAKKCTVAISVVLKNSQFYGQKPLDAGKFVYPEMELAGEVIAVAAAEKLLTTVRGDNRDNPPYQGSGTKMIPQSNQSFCLADQLVEPVNALRLDARGQHLPQVSGVDEMSISYVKDIYGLVHTFQWSTDKKTGDELKNWDASPVLMTSEYSGFKIKSDDFYCIPPIAALSSMFAYWSGELKFRFDFVATQFHTGRVMVVYVPFLTSKINFEQAKSYPYEVWDLREHQQFIFNVPYIANVPCFKRRIGFTSTLDMFIPPGRLYMFVLTGLVAMENISKQIDINVYMAGGETFEVQIPAQPSIATCFYATDDTPSALVRAIDGSFPWYFGNDSKFVDDKGDEHIIARYSTYWNDMSFYANLKQWKYYKMTADSAKTNENISVQFVEGNYKIKDLFYVPVQLDDGTGLTHMSACSSQLQAQNYWRKGWQGAGREECLTIANLTTSPYCINNPIFDEFDVTPRTESIPSDCEIVEHEMGEREVGNSIEQETSNCRVYGLDNMLDHGIFGEKFTSLKTLCRRYQPYGLASVKGTGTYGDVLFSMPAIPHGLDLYLADSKILPVLKRVREGIIPVVLSAYRFFSGGLRFNLVSSTKSKNVWIQHRPDYEGLAKISYPGTQKNIESLVNSGYAMYLQSTSVNNVINFEVPYYKNRPLIYLQKPATDSSQLEGATHLGQIYVGAEGGKTDEDFNCGIMYSLADDAHAHVFQGFPPMLFLDTVQNPTTFSGIRSNQWEMPLLSTNHKVELPEEATKMMDSVSNLVSNLDSKISGFSDKIDVVKDTMKETLMDLLGHLGHVLINPTSKQISWSIVHMLIRFGLVNKFDIHKLMEPINSMAGYMASGTGVASTPTEPEYFRGIGLTSYAKKNVDNLINHEGPYFEGVRTDLSTYTSILPIVLGFVTSLICCISSVLSMKAPPKDSGGLFGIISALTHRVATCARDLKSLGDFFSGLIESFYKILEYIGLYNNPNKIFEHFMNDELPLINDWFVEAKYLCDPVREVHVFARDAALSDRLEECYALGVTIASHFINLQQNNDEKKRSSLMPYFAIFKDTFAEVSSRRNDMMARGVSSLSRREPFCVYISGPPGVGKSQMAQSMIPRLLRDQGIIYVGEPTYTLMCGADYWNGCKQQPCVLIDDWLSIDAGTPKENDLKAFTLLKSCAILTPPQAAIPDKQMRYAPELMVVLSNKSFPEPIGVDHDMLWRRRDVLVECRMREELGDYKNMTDRKEYLHAKIASLGLDTRPPKFEHLEFRVAYEPSKQSTRWRVGEKDKKWMSYAELLPIINNQFTIHRNWQIEAFNERREDYEQNLINERNNFTPSLKERQDEFKRACKFLSTYIAKDSAQNLNIFKLASDYAKRGFIPEKEREKIVLAGRDSLLAKLDKERDQIKKVVAGEELFVNFECTNFPCAAEECPAEFKDMIETFNYIIKDKDAMSKLPIKDSDMQSTLAGLKNLCEYTYTTMKEEEKWCEIKDWHTIYNTLDVPAGYDCSLQIAKMPVTAESTLVYLFINKINYYCKKLGNFRGKKTKDNLLVIQFVFFNKCHELRFKMKETKTADKLAIEFTLDDIIVDCQKNLGQCKHKLCYSLIDYQNLHISCIPGFLCKCYTFDSTFIYDKEKKIFKKEGVELNLKNCLDPLCYQKKPIWASRIWSWKKANPTLVKLRECPEDFCHFTDKIVLFIEGVKKYFKENYPCIYNFFDNYVSPFFKKVFSIIKALLPYVIGIGALGALLHYLGYSDKIMSRAVALKSTIGNLYGKKKEVYTGDVQTMSYEDFEEAQLEAVSEPTPEVIAGLCSEDIAEEAIHELIHSGDNVKPKKFNRHKVGVKPTVRKVSRLESGLFINEAYTSLRERIKKNSFFMKSPVGDSFRILLIHEQKFIFLKHYWEALNMKFAMKGWKLINCATANEYSISPHLWKFDFEDNSQIGFVNIKEIPPQRSLLKTFLKDTKSHKQGVGQCMIISPDIGGCQQLVVFPKLEKSVDIAARGDMSAQKLCDIYSYSWSAPGNCCSLLIDPSRNPCVLGVHVAGNGYTGYAECLTKDQFEAWMPDYIEREDDFCSEVLLPGEVDENMEGEFIPIGKINYQLAHNESGESQIQPSLVSGKLFPVTTDIAPLNNHDPRMPQGYSPMFAGVNNMFKPPLIFDQNDVDEAEKYFENELLALCKPVTSVTRKRTLLEVVDGIPNLKYFDGLVMNTSEGFPFSSYRPNSASNKSWLFKRSGNPIQTDAIHHDLLKVLESDNSKRIRGYAVNTVFVDCLKDSRIALDKVLTPGKTRIFSISPVQFSLAFKEKFQDFLAAFKTHRLKLEHAIGISPDGPEWGEMVKVVNQHFKGYGKVFDNTDEGFYFSGDYKNFGPSLSSQIVQSVNNIILSWCRKYYEDTNEDDERVRRCLLYERTFSYHLCFDNLYQPICGAPSGGPDTVELNTMVNKFYIYLALKHIINTDFQKNLDTEINFRFQPDMFKNLIHMISYGDDVYFKIHKNLVKDFNNVQLSIFFQNYRIGYTDASKSDTFDQFKTQLCEITFLKRGFVPHPKWRGEYLAPLDENVSVKDVCNWIHKSSFNTKLESTILSIEGCGANAYSLGPDKHREIRSKLQSALIDLGCDTYLRTWDNWDEIHFAPYYFSIKK